MPSATSFSHWNSFLHAVLLTGLLLPLLGAVLLESQPAANDDIIRIRILAGERVDEVEITAVGGTVSIQAEPGAAVLAEMDAGESTTIRRRDAELAIEIPDGAGLYADRVLVRPSPGAKWAITSSTQSGGSRTYNGSLQVRWDSASPRELTLVNLVPLETYVESVVASEYGFDDLEGAKAMAVLARTYALYNQGKYGDSFDHVDHALSQAYKGADVVTETARRATRSTEGEILTYNDEPIQAVYFSSSGGHTANNEDLWAAEPIPYLRGRSDPYDANSPHDEWTATADRSKLLSRLSRAYGIDAKGFVLGDRGSDGRVQTIRILGPGSHEVEISANEFRLFANQQISSPGIRSTLFTATREGNQYIFEGSGYGHGVGLSQYGALEMSRQGHSYQEILGFYFTDVSLASHDGTALLASPSDDDAIDRSEPPSSEPDTTRRTRRIGW